MYIFQTDVTYWEPVQEFGDNMVDKVFCNFLQYYSLP